jgi:aryl-alcohol dehydrogenase-like predicted oxidoreductase
MPNFAMTENTHRYAKKFSGLGFNQLGNTELLTNKAGFGGYRIHISVEEHRAALEHALCNGINLIDTSSNYADGGSEELIGAVVKNLVKEKKIEREEVIIVSKAGYLQAQNYQLSQELKQQGKPFPELVEYANGLEHCIHPDFIADQLTRSLNRLQLKTIDFYLLHNPEYYLLWAHKQGMDLTRAQDEYYRRIEQAFMHLEIEAQNGRIKYYGISSNAFPIFSKRYDFTSVERVWEIAERISPKHKFRMVQMPMNLLENGAATEKNLSGDISSLEYARSKDLAVLVNRPLNAFVNNKMKRLVSLVIKDKFIPGILHQKFMRIKELETEFTAKVLPALKTEAETQKNLSGYFSSGHYIEENIKKLGPYWQWIENQARSFTEQISYAVQLVNEIPGKNRETIDWLNRYVAHFNELLGYLTLYFGQESANEGKNILQKIRGDLPLAQNFESLQDAALGSLFNTPGISSTLIGMRAVEYVNNVLCILASQADGAEKKNSL